MSQLLYFVDGHHRITRDQARQFGLAYAFPDTPFVCAEYTAAGPGGTHGCVLGRSDERLGYYKDRQTWMKIPPSKGAEQPAPLHVGFWNESRPTPSELLVLEPLRGSPVRLGDGNPWTVPIARSWNDRADQAGWYNALPGKLALSESGDWMTGGVDAKHAHLWELATQWWESMMGRTPDAEGMVRFEFQGAHDAAVSVLATNYRIGRAEVALLGLFDDQFYAASEILNTLIDWPVFIAWAKKNLIEQATVGLSSPVGVPAATPPTARRSPTSGHCKRSRRK